MTHRRGYKNTKERVARRRTDAEERQLARDARTKKEQLELIGRRPGVSKRECDRLLQPSTPTKKKIIAKGEKRGREERIKQSHE